MDAFFNSIMDWLNSGQYTFFTDLGAWAVKKAVYGYLAFINFAIPFAWGIAKEILSDLQITQAINAAWSGLDSDVRAIATFFKIPDAMNILLSGGVTRLVLKFVPGW